MIDWDKVDKEVEMEIGDFVFREVYQSEGDDEDKSMDEN